MATPASTKSSHVMNASEAAVFETFVVPRYLSLFGELATEMLVEGDDAQVIHVNCRTGYPDRGIHLKLPTAHVYGCDASSAAIELAKTKAATKAGMTAEYRVAESFPLPFPDGAFSHGLTLHPLAAPDERKRLFSELARLIAPRGQVVIAMPLRGSFQEFADLLREYALKHESTDAQTAVEAAVLVRPTPEMLKTELEKAGFQFIEVDSRPRTLKFQSGRDFFEDPVARLLLLPEFRLNLAMRDAEPLFAYVREAIDKYWSQSTFELGVQVGCVSGRRNAIAPSLLDRVSSK